MRLKAKKGCEVQVTAEGHLRFRGWKRVQDGSPSVTVEIQAGLLLRALKQQEGPAVGPPAEVEVR